MDNVCHTLVGAAIGEAGLKRHTRFASATLMIAANLPDVDVLVFATSMPSLAFRRGWTHGPAGQIVLPLLLTAVMLAVTWRRPRGPGVAPVRPLWLLLLACIGVLSHVALDLLNPYGLRILAPFDWRWFYGDTLFIIDPWIWLMFGSSIWLARRRRSPMPARRGLVVAAVYIVLMMVAAWAARDIVIETWRGIRRVEPRAAMVGPMPVTPFRRQIVIDAGDHYETGMFDWLPRQVTFYPGSVPKNDTDPRVAQARDAVNVRGFLVWSRFPFWTFEPEPGGTRVTVGDMRFAGQSPARFEASTLVPE